MVLPYKNEKSCESRDTDDIFCSWEIFEFFSCGGLPKLKYGCDNFDGPDTGIGRGSVGGLRDLVKHELTASGLGEFFLKNCGDGGGRFGSGGKFVIILF